MSGVCKHAGSHINTVVFLYPYFLMHESLAIYKLACTNSSSPFSFNGLTCVSFLFFVFAVSFSMIRMEQI